MSPTNKPQPLTDDEVMANLSGTELAIVDAMLSRAKGQPVTVDGSAYLHENVQPITVGTHVELARHIAGLKGERRALVLQNLSGQLLADMVSDTQDNA